MITKADMDAVARMRRRAPWMLGALMIVLIVFGGWVGVGLGVLALVVGAPALAAHHRRLDPGGACASCSKSCLASTGLEAECSCGCEAHR